MKRTINLALIFLGTIVCHLSCQKAPELTITSPASIDLNVDGSSGSITFTANRDWTVSTSDSWVTISPSSGEASDKPVTVSVRCDANTTYDDRTATVTIRMEELFQTVAVRQPANLGIVLPAQSYELASNAKTLEISVQANVQYAVSSSVGWIKQMETKGLTTNKQTFSIEDNKTFDTREGMITIKQTDGDLTETISVKQNSFLQAVDLGLSVKWASVNVGAYSQEEYGEYFAWGETQVKDFYLWDNYKWCDGNSDTLTKYNDTEAFGSVDNMTLLEQSDDVAHVRYGKGWRIPTDAEWTELIGQCIWTNTSLNGIEGWLVSSNKNDNSIFLPTAGVYYGDYENRISKYWSACLKDSFSAITVSISFGSISKSTDTRCFGLPVRPVTE